MTGSLVDYFVCMLSKQGSIQTIEYEILEEGQLLFEEICQNGGSEFQEFVSPALRCKYGNRTLRQALSPPTTLMQTLPVVQFQDLKVSWNSSLLL